MTSPSQLHIYLITGHSHSLPAFKVQDPPPPPFPAPDNLLPGFFYVYFSLNFPTELSSTQPKLNLAKPLNRPRILEITPKISKHFK